MVTGNALETEADTLLGCLSVFSVDAVSHRTLQLISTAAQHTKQHQKEVDEIEIERQSADDSV